ncbi:hypothetical protein FHU23_003289 [Clostridium saccharobutylicum]|uniref:Uncharacterized protein n=1 Tax=Clostridium saccharobutylicum DSM 13864 TaxID=1345695 RepID=U5MRM5_CLOSA|nr:hypothetical protein CLSA_c21960 [Clostridium saccharobutylicum DSM 13864]MBA2906646.1 hypothetical protein [Clostridium saccharobutylicum]MBA8791168.1 hypothetical protein [Clostridium saccharobutylicum]MBA8897899.1 hypothetical protein [Clostridium saccharobutylicum]MBA8980605.1 hypothetical protein [Clostridium saccharobutylicum]
MKNIEELHRDEMSTKLRKSVDLTKTGQNIKFLDEEEFLKICFY